MNSIQRFLNTWTVALTAALALAFMIMVPLFISSDQSVLAQTSPEPGDYRSALSGTWNNASNWEVWDGDSWNSASTWPGQNPADDYTVTIQSGHVISDNNVNTLFFGDLIVYGHLNLSHDLYLENTSYILIDKEFYDGIDITTGGSIRWLNKLELHLPENAALGVNVKDDSGTMIEGLGLYGQNSGNNKMRLVIGTIDYAAASGGGNVEYTFDDVNENGGILAAVALANPEEFYYQGSSTTFTTTLTGEATGLGSGPEYTTFSWTGTGPNGFSFSFDGQNPGPVNLGYSSGTYTFTLTAESNYDDFTYSTSQDVIVIIHPAPLTITALDQVREYGETFTLDQTKFSVNGLMEGDAVTSIVLTSDGAAPDAKVGGYDIIPTYASGNGLANYTTSFVKGTLWVGSPTVTIRVLNQTKEYGINFPYQGTFTGATAIDNLIANEVIEITGLLDGDSVESITLTSNGAAASATVSGSGYSIVAGNAQGTGLDNYSIMYVNGVLTVNPRALTITAQSSSKTYGDAVTFSGTEFNSSGLVNGDAISIVSLTSNGAVASATVTGSAYTIRASDAQGSGLDNYTIIYVDGVLVVNPRALTITALSSSKAYGDAVTFSGTEFTSDGLVNGDTVNSVALHSDGAAASASVGQYPITPSEAEGTGLENYTISYANGTLSVTDNPLLTITALEQDKEYGSAFTFEGTEFIVDGLRDGDAVNSITLTSDGAAATAAVGTYTIIPSEADGTGLENYTITYINSSLTVDPRALTITANSISKTYGNTVVFAGTEFVSSGLVNGDTVSRVNLFSDGAAASAPVTSSPYPIITANATGTGLENYNITWVNGTLTVNPRALTVTAASTSKTYGDTVAFTGTEFDSEGLVNGDMVAIASTEFNIFDPAGSDMIVIASAGFDSEGLVNGDAIASVNLTSSGADAAATVDSSPYAILASNATGSGLDNYAITYIDGQLSISPLIIHVIAGPQSKTFGEADPALTYTFSPDLVGNDTFTGSLARESGEDTGNYSITQGTLALSSSYILDYTGADLTIIEMQAPFEVNNLMITPSARETWAGITFTRYTNQEVLITVEVSNTGGQSETYHGVLKLNGEEITGNDITLESGDSGQLTFTLSDLPGGDYTVEIEGLSGEFSNDKWTNVWLISNLILTVIFIGYLIKRYAFKRDTGSSILERED